jgi:hypothetical protein
MRDEDFEIIEIALTCLHVNMVPHARVRFLTVITEGSRQELLHVRMSTLLLAACHVAD